jgi:hypothetical protein
MARSKKPIPKSQAELSQAQITPLISGSKTPIVDTKARQNQRRVDNDTVKRFNVGLRDIDETIIYYFNNVIRPSVMQNGNKVNVPILYGSPERWAAVQKDGFYRDKNGKIMTPLIMFKRDSIEKNRNLGNKLDGNSPSNFGIFKKNFSKKNVYDRFSVVTNREPIEEYYGVIIPDYVSLSYSCVIFTDYIEQMNKIVEAINFASDSYWGDPEKFSFRAMIDNYTTSTELAQGQDRAVKTNFNINMIGHIVSDSINASIAGMNKFYSKSSVTFGLEVAGTLEELSARARTAEADTAYRFFDQGTTGVQRFGMTREQIEYLNVNNTAFADSVLTGAARFDDKTIVEPPSNFSDGQERFSVYINGTVVPNTYTTITQQGTDILVQVQTNNLGYRLDAGDEVVLVGKFK